MVALGAGLFSGLDPGARSAPAQKGALRWTALESAAARRW